jgi:hypothetical protein
LHGRERRSRVGTEGATAVGVPVTVGATTGVCVVLTPQPSGYLTLGEVEVFAKAPGVSADASLSSIEVDGRPLAGFDPDQTDYRVTVAHLDRAVVTATATDPYITVRIDRDRSIWLIAVTSEDGTQNRTYRVETTTR